MNAEDLKSPLKAAGVAGVKKTTQEFRKQAVFYTPGGFLHSSRQLAVKHRISAMHCLAIAS